MCVCVCVCVCGYTRLGRQARVHVDDRYVLVLLAIREIGGACSALDDGDMILFVENHAALNIVVLLANLWFTYAYVRVRASVCE